MKTANTLTQLVMLTLVALALIPARVAYSEVDPRHTPGFPEYLPENIEELLEYLRRMFGSDYEEPAKLAELYRLDDVNSIIGMMRSEYTRTLVGNALDAYSRGELTEEDLYRYFQALQSWYEESSGAGVDVTEDYLLALRALGLLAEKAGYHDFSSRADELIYSVLRSLLEAGQGLPGDQVTQPPLRLPEFSPLEPPELSLPSSFGSSEIQAPGFTINPPSGGLPAFTLPSLPGISVPAVHVDWRLLGLVATPLLILLFAIAIVKWSPRVLGALSRVAHATKPLLGVPKQGAVESALPRSIALYWQAVEYVSRKYGVQKQPSATHREFLDKARHALEGWRAGFLAQLTHVYELVRYGGVQDPSYDDRAERAYRGLVEKA